MLHPIAGAPNIYTARLDYAQHVFSNTIPRHS